MSKTKNDVIINDELIIFKKGKIYSQNELEQILDIEIDDYGAPFFGRVLQVTSSILELPVIFVFKGMGTYPETFEYRGYYTSAEHCDALIDVHRENILYLRKMYGL